MCIIVEHEAIWPLVSPTGLQQVLLPYRNIYPEPRVFDLKETNTTGASPRVCVVLPATPVWQRRQARSDKDDDVPYLLAQTARSNALNEAGVALGGKGVGSHAVSRECMARALGMFCGKGLEGVHRAVVVALLWRRGSSSLSRYGLPLFCWPKN